MFEEYEEIDSKLDNLEDSLALLNNIQPINNTESKKKFFLGEEFIFEYKELSYDPELFEELLNDITIPQGLLHDLFVKKINELKLMHQINKHRTNAIEYSIKLYGKPDIALCNEAKKILAEKFVEEEKIIDSTVIKETLEYYLQKYGLNEWRVEFHDKNQTVTDRQNKLILVAENRMYSDKDPERLAVHEIGVHALRSENGSLQPLALFNSGFPNYLLTEEGLATYYEEKAGVLNRETLVKYAARVLAVDGLCRNCSFGQTFERLKIYDLSDDFIWDVCIRVYRAGGFTKDYLYLKGFFAIKEFLQDKEEKLMFLGKFGMEDYDLVKELLEKKYLRQAVYLPEFL